jgi:hypothetical protein
MTSDMLKRKKKKPGTFYGYPASLDFRTLINYLDWSKPNSHFGSLETDGNETTHQSLTYLIL